QLGGGNDEWIALNVWPRRRDVGDLRDLFRAGNSPKGRVRGRMDHRFPLARLDECGRGVVERCGMEAVALIRLERVEIRLADTYRVRQPRREYRLQVARRTGDHAQRLGGRGLLLQRFPQFIKQPRILDGDDGLCSEVPNQFDLLVTERAHLLAVDRN